jgi:Fis family transcriptional regulator|tara:strand:- start:175 stop:477 length:303 start_codon:yes stop_codon:yes gene_type:complete
MNSAEQNQLQAAEQVSPSTPSENHSSQSLRYSVAEAMQRYFADLDGQETRDLYDLVMTEVEPPLLSAAMNYTRQNQSKTAELLGLNRGTLRKKLKQYNLL